jgi:hypothetical protein
MLTITVPARESHTNKLFSIGDRIYLVAEDQFPETRKGTMCLINKQYMTIDEVLCIVIKENMRTDRTPDGVSGCYPENIIMDYTAHMQKVMAAYRIARTWRAYKKK